MSLKIGAVLCKSLDLFVIIEYVQMAVVTLRATGSVVNQLGETKIYGRYFIGRRISEASVSSGQQIEKTVHVRIHRQILI